MAVYPFIKHIPNILTLARIFFVFIIGILMFIDNSFSRVFSVVLAVLACITDFFDGKIARKYNVVSDFGRCMDPIADKALVMTLMVMLVYLEKVWVFTAIIILFREFVVAGLREFIAKEKNITIPVSKLAKVKTASQMISLIFLMIVGSNMILSLIGNILLTFSALLSIITGMKYIYSVRRFLINK